MGMVHRTLEEYVEDLCTILNGPIDEGLQIHLESPKEKLDKSGKDFVAATSKLSKLQKRD